MRPGNAILVPCSLYMNGRENKHQKHSRQPLSIDGITRRGGGGRDGSIGFNRAGGVRSSGRPIGDFSRPEGLRHSTTVGNSSITVPRRPQYDMPDKKRRFAWPWRKKRDERLGSYERKRRRSKRLKIAGIIVLILLAVFGFLVAKGYINLRKVLSGGGGAAALEENVDPSKLRVEGDGRVNILLMGRGGPGHEGADLTDTMILVSVDPVAKEAGLVSIPRDLYVKVPGDGSMKINSVFYTGKAEFMSQTSKRDSQTKKDAENAGMDLAQKTVENVLGVPIHYHAIIDFSGFKQAIDTVGGVDINVPSAVYERMWIDGRNYILNEKPGRKHMGGFEALAYARSRHTSKRGDFDRAERQRLMIVALKDKVLSLGTFSNPAKLSSLIDQFGSHVKTNFSTDDVTKLYSLMRQIDSSKVTSIGLSDPPNNFVKTANLGGLSVVIPTAGVGNYKEIQYYIRNKLRDSFLKMENAKVIVLNGTNRPGLATDKTYELKSFGYFVGKTENAPTRNYSKTVIIDMGHGDKKYTRHYLENRFRVLSTRNLPDASIQPGDADFVIILGNDISSG